MIRRLSFLRQPFFVIDLSRFESSVTQVSVTKDLHYRSISYHLFPIRFTEYQRFDAVNYQELDICKPGRKYGSSEKLPLYKFPKEPLTAKYGTDWYNELEIAAEYILSKK